MYDHKECAPEAELVLESEEPGDVCLVETDLEKVFRKRAKGEKGPPEKKEFKKNPSSGQG